MQPKSFRHALRLCGAAFVRSGKSGLCVLRYSKYRFTPFQDTILFVNSSLRMMRVMFYVPDKARGAKAAELLQQ